MEGYLPLTHAVGWTAASLPSVVYGVRQLSARVRPENGRMRLSAASAFTFLLSALKLPSVAGSCSHPTGTALGTLLVGAPVMAPVALLVLTFQAVLLAHGGISTLGANLFAMGIVGPWVAVAVFRGGTRAGVPMVWSAGAAAVLGDLATYVMTSLQLALAHPAIAGSVSAAFMRFAGLFAFTQLPIALLEGLLTVLVLRALPADTLGTLALLQPRPHTAAPYRARRVAVAFAMAALLGVVITGLWVTPGTRIGTDDRARTLVSEVPLPPLVATPLPSASMERVLFAVQGMTALAVLLVTVTGLRRQVRLRRES
jgi:cobalt/nickel transport system permease protein